MKNSLSMGIVRNKFGIYQQNKKKIQRRKNRFKIMDKGDSLQQSTPRISEMLLTSASTNSVQSLDTINISQTCQDLYKQARQKIAKVSELQKKMSNLSKARLTSFKQKQNQRHDQQISKLASQATTNLSQSQKLLKKLSKIQVTSDVQIKLIKNVQISLAQQIRQCSKSLRQQERQYYNTIRQYDNSTSNRAIQLSEEQKKMMFSAEEEMIIEQRQQNSQSNNKIHELVQSINKLSGIYKELNNLVIEQGSLIDRIDYNIQQTFQHTKNAVVHLEAANQHASNPFADRVIKILVIMILSMAFILGLKYMN